MSAGGETVAVRGFVRGLGLLIDAEWSPQQAFAVFELISQRCAYELFAEPDSGWQERNCAAKRRNRDGQHKLAWQRLWEIGRRKLRLRQRVSGRN